MGGLLLGPLKVDFEIFLQALNLNRMAFLLDLSTLGAFVLNLFFFLSCDSKN